MREGDEIWVAGDKAKAADLYVTAWEGTPENPS